jgi:hypothetical protein
MLSVWREWKESYKFLESEFAFEKVMYLPPLPPHYLMPRRHGLGDDAAGPISL